MRKVTTPAKVCSECGSRLIAEKYEDFCDRCKEKLPEGVRLRLTVFFEGYDNATHYEFCSWKCTLDWMQEFPLNKKKVSFVSLPYVSGSASDFITVYNEFFEAIRDLQGVGN